MSSIQVIESCIIGRNYNYLAFKKLLYPHPQQKILNGHFLTFQETEHFADPRSFALRLISAGHREKHRTWEPTVKFTFLTPAGNQVLVSWPSHHFALIPQLKCYSYTPRERHWALAHGFPVNRSLAHPAIVLLPKCKWWLRDVWCCSPPVSRYTCGVQGHTVSQK